MLGWLEQLGDALGGYVDERRDVRSAETLAVQFRHNLSGLLRSIALKPIRLGNRCPRTADLG